jgi:hypothetical protein
MNPHDAKDARKAIFPYGAMPIAAGTAGGRRGLSDPLGASAVAGVR